MTIEAVKMTVRERGVEALDEPANIARLLTFDDVAFGHLNEFADQAKAALRRAGHLRPVIVDDDWEPPSRAPEGPGEGDEIIIDAPASALPAAFVTPDDWPDEPPPPVDWIAHQRIVRGDVATLHADGGGGKTQAALQLAWAMTAEAPDWLGTTIDPGPVVFLSAEEPEAEIRRRLHRIRERFPFDGRTDGLRFWFPNDVQGCTFAIADKSGVMVPTPLFASLRSAVVAVRPALVVLDNVAAVFGGNQNDRVLVRTFVNLWRALAREADCAVLLLDHPSLSGLTNGTGRAGNVDWRNSVRTAMYIKPAEDRADADRGVRVLEMVKNNYAPIAQPLRLEWVNGNLHVEGTNSPLHRSTRDRGIDELFLALLDERNRTGRHVAAAKSSTYAPAVFAEMPGSIGTTSKAFAQAMERLFATGAITIETTGPASKRRQRIVRAVASAATESLA